VPKLLIFGQGQSFGEAQGYERTGNCNRPFVAQRSHAATHLQNRSALHFVAGIQSVSPWRTSVIESSLETGNFSLPFFRHSPA
jgi:hypothetical protein